MYHILLILLYCVQLSLPLLIFTFTKVFFFHTADGRKETSVKNDDLLKVQSWWLSSEFRQYCRNARGGQQRASAVEFPLSLAKCSCLLTAG